MLRWIEHYLYGFLRLRMKGFTSERFFNLCGSNGIEVWGVTYQNQEYSFCMTLKDYRRCKPFVRKAKVRLRIEKRFGLPFFLYRYRKRKLFFSGLALFFVILYAMSLFIWDIQFDGNTKYTDDMLLHFLESEEITYGMRKSLISCEDLEADLRNQFNEITWVSARVTGTRLFVQVKENEVLLFVPQKEDMPCNLVAEKDGVVTSIVTRTGKPQVKAGDTVEKGQILVEGIIPITNDGGEVVNAHQVRSDADITARTSYEFKKTISVIHQVDSETGKTKKGVFFRVMPYSFVWMLPKKEGSAWKTEMEEKQLKIFENFYLPVYWGMIEGREYITYEKNYSQEELEGLAEEYKNQIVEKLIEKGVQIIQNNVKILINGSNCQFQVQIDAEERIGVAEPISETEETLD